MLRNSCDYVHTLNMILAKIATSTHHLRARRRALGRIKEEKRLDDCFEACQANQQWTRADFRKAIRLEDYRK